VSERAPIMSDRAPMKVVSLNVDLPKTVQWRDQSVTTGIFKSPVEGRVALRKHNLDGDQQADLSVHGGPTKAVYVYPTQHYTYWREELPDVELAWGHFGENFTVDGMDEESIFIGDEFSVETARVVVTEPRMPCFKLGVLRRGLRRVRRSPDHQRTGAHRGRGVGRLRNPRLWGGGGVRGGRRLARRPRMVLVRPSTRPLVDRRGLRAFVQPDGLSLDGQETAFSPGHSIHRICEDAPRIRKPHRRSGGSSRFRGTSLHPRRRSLAHPVGVDLHGYRLGPF